MRGYSNNHCSNKEGAHHVEDGWIKGLQEHEIGKHENRHTNFFKWACLMPRGLHCGIHFVAGAGGFSVAAGGFSIFSRIASRYF